MSYDDRKEGFRAGMLKAMTLARISMPTEDFDRDVKEYMARFPREPNPARVSIGDLAHWYGQGSECRRNGGSSPYAGNTIAHSMHAWGWLAQDLRMALDAARGTNRKEAEAQEIPGIKSNFEDAKQSSDLYADMAAEMVKGLEAAGMREQHRQRNRERSGMVDAINAPYGQRARTVADVVRERGIEALFSGADYTTRMNAQRFMRELRETSARNDQFMTDWGRVANDAIILLLERVK